MVGMLRKSFLVLYVANFVGESRLLNHGRGFRRTLNHQKRKDRGPGAPTGSVGAKRIGGSGAYIF